MEDNFNLLDDFLEPSDGSGDGISTTLSPLRSPLLKQHHQQQQQMLHPPATADSPANPAVPQVFSEFIDCFADTKDLETVQAITQSICGAKKAASDRAKKLQAVIRELSQRVETMETSLMQTRNELPGTMQIAEKLEQDAQQLKQDLEDSNKENRDLNRQLKHLSHRRQRLSMHKFEVVKDEDKEEPITNMIAQQICLYNCITAVRWDFTSSHVRGYVVLNSKEKQRKFDFDPAVTSDFDITNLLWDTISALPIKMKN
eukprot:gnl/Hemi2/11250_TR3895_c0_g1_i1.p1 gnl/Hemi2/11250_TR3895_c0_g1~~gnl/Hemi2/11250_TR3895_c0_g1_i1.p1  ORF type:complete len:258 (-),score=103.46 gnl/Hemi2/11250_TR3895_c0_g1_i1:100-873(-)